MSHTEVIIIVVAFIAMAIDPFIEWWQMTTSISQNISSLEWSVNDLTIKLDEFKSANCNNPSVDKAELDEAFDNLNIASTDLVLAKHDYAANDRKSAMVAIKEGFAYALKVREFLAKQNKD